jgi:hypothetical protein
MIVETVFGADAHLSPFFLRNSARLFRTVGVHVTGGVQEDKGKIVWERTSITDAG